MGAFLHCVVGLWEEDFTIISECHSHIPVEIDLPPTEEFSWGGLTSSGEGVVEEVDPGDRKADHPRKEFEGKGVRKRMEN